MNGTSGNPGQTCQPAAGPTGQRWRVGTRRRRRIRDGVMSALLIGLAAAPGRAEDAQGLRLFADRVEPLLQQHCHACHSHAAGVAKGGLMLDSAAARKAGGDSGPIITKGAPEQSALFQVVAGLHTKHNRADLFAFDEEEIETLRQWIQLGAPSPASRGSAAADATEKSPGHWSFQPVTRPPVPGRADGKSAGDGRSGSAVIDAFVAAKLAEHSAALRPAADRRTLVRRAYFDLLGLPPSPEEVESFAGEAHPEAYGRLISRLLDSPHYGERWGRHWLDVAGFAESSMFIGDIPRQGFWRYRDYVIRAFNQDKPFDEFITEQLAGDELFDWRAAEHFSDEQIELLAATGFLRCTPDATDNQAITQMDKRYIAQQAAVEVSMKALMGLTINCVRCHDHKFDPIRQEEYYQLIAVFQPVYDPDQWLPGIWSEANAGPLRAIPLLPGDQRRRIMNESPGWFDERLELAQQLKIGIERPFRDRWLAGRLEEIDDEAVRQRLTAVLATPADGRTEADEEFCAAEAQRLGWTEEKVKELFPEIEERKSAVKARLKEIGEQNKAVFRNVIWAAFDASEEPRPTPFLKRGNYETPGHEVRPGVIAALDAPDRSPGFDQPPGAWTSGRRLALARWLTHPEHPLVARVMVNRIWQYHFGTGLVSTPDDFGARGAHPVSQELLDWLAAEFVEGGWSVKHLHRLIMNSDVYRQETVADRSDTVSTALRRLENEDEDENEDGSPAPLAAFNPGPRRLGAGEIRDAMLAASGLLDDRLFGESVPTERRKDGAFAVRANHPDRHRRSVYIHTRRTYVPTFLTLFDEPQMDTNWPVRSNSAIAQQALALMNEPFVIGCATAMAERVKSEGGTEFEGRLDRAFRLAYQRAPLAEERTLFADAAAGVEEPWPVICQALLSSSEFLYVD
ncbi:MAG TPA: hypothetical protein DCY13_14475 [Verrucomicrobiales bacterium]|nr:hypothetical protein [Verrucomicrobiales bacterium]